MKKLFLFVSILSATLLCAMMLFILPASAATASDSCGVNGNHVRWTLNTSTGLLRVTGEGEMRSMPSWNYSYSAQIKTVIIEEGVTNIGYDAFADCTNLTQITIPGSVTGIDTSAFENCTALTSIILPDTLTYIGGEAFYGCTALTSIVIPNSVTGLGWSAFEGCTSLTSVILPETLTSIERSTFQNCTSLTEITLPDSAKLGLYAFAGCTSLTSINIPSAVTWLRDGTFNGCTNLTNVTIPSSVNWISSFAFNGCDSLKTVTYLGTKKEWRDIRIDEGNDALLSAELETQGFSGLPGWGIILIIVAILIVLIFGTIILPGLVALIIVLSVRKSKKAQAKAAASLEERSDP